MSAYLWEWLASPLHWEGPGCQPELDSSALVHNPDQFLATRPILITKYCFKVIKCLCYDKDADHSI